jgi:hypothetical protein
MVKRKEKFFGYLPDGKPCGSLPRYLRSWRKMYKPLCKALDVHVVGFEPGLLVADKTGRYVDLPIWFALRISNAVGKT